MSKHKKTMLLLNSHHDLRSGTAASDDKRTTTIFKKHNDIDEFIVKTQSIIIYHRTTISIMRKEIPSIIEVEMRLLR